MHGVQRQVLQKVHFKVIARNSIIECLQPQTQCLCKFTETDSVASPSSQDTAPTVSLAYF